jgi:sulfoquinovosidase
MFPRSSFTHRLSAFLARTRCLSLPLALAALGAILWAGRGGSPVIARLTAGSLTFDAGKLPQHKMSTGDFVLSWEPLQGGTLTVTHRAEPARVLWSTVRGHNFVSAAQGHARIRESRGAYTVRDTLEVLCNRQTIDEMRQVDEQVIVSGTLQCNRVSRRVNYALIFQERLPNQLAFELVLADASYNRTYLTYATDRDEHFFGFGVQSTQFDLKGRRLPIFVTEQGIGRGLQPLTTVMNLWGGAGGTWYTSYAVAPHYITSRLRSLFLENYEYAVFDLRNANSAHIEVFADHLDGRILYGGSPRQLIAEYTSVVGRMRPLPQWTQEGAIVGIQGGTAAVRGIYERLDAAGTPVAALWLQDWVGQRVTTGGMGKQLWWNWALNRRHYPAWEQLRDDLAADDVRLMLYISPFLVDVPDDVGHTRNLFREAAEKGYLIRRPDGMVYLIKNTTFSAGLVDLTNPAAYAWLQQIIRDDMIAIGAAGWMADFGEALPTDAVLSSGESAFEYHNRYPEAWARLNREVLDASTDGAAMFFFSRSGYRESPKYATAFWLGDQLVSWDEHDGIKSAVTGLLSGGISGFSLNHSDIGGYTTINTPILKYRRSEELLMRWMELNAFTVLYRSHEGFLPEANAQVYSDDKLIAHFNRFARVYRSLAFYREELMQEAAETGLPVVRHPFINHPENAAFYGMSYQQFMLGTELMVAPVLDPGVEQLRVHLPAGSWRHLWSRRQYEIKEPGMYITVEVPLGEPAVFYRSDSVVAAQFIGNLRQLGVLQE